MVKKILLLLALYALMIIFEWGNFKKQQRKAQLIYFALIAVSLYLALDYVVEAKLQNLNKVLDFLFGSWVKQIMQYFMQSA